MIEHVSIQSLIPHPRNYREHPPDEIQHLMQSIREHGIYRNIVISRDHTILAGHGVVEAATRLGLKEVPVHRVALDANDPRAIKLLVSDNEVSHLALNDDRVLTELLKELKDSDLDLLGTGYDEMMLANLVMVTRPEHEIADLDHAAQWVGMPEYKEGEDKVQILISFANEEDCQQFCELNDLGRGKEAVKGARKSFWWPPRENDDVTSLLFTSGAKHE